MSVPGWLVVSQSLVRSSSRKTHTLLRFSLSAEGQGRCVPGWTAHSGDEAEGREEGRGERGKGEERGRKRGGGRGGKVSIED